MTQEMIINTVNQMVLAADQRDWEVCRRCFTDKIFVDYTSLAGGEPASLSADVLINSWQDLLPGFTATQHLMGSHVINIQDNMASCLAHCQATHILDEEQWVLGGLYNFQLTLNSGTWLITSITMTALWSVGNQAKLLELASARAAASSNKK